MLKAIFVSNKEKRSFLDKSSCVNCQVPICFSSLTVSDFISEFNDAYCSTRRLFVIHDFFSVLANRCRLDGKIFNYCVYIFVLFFWQTDWLSENNLYWSHSLFFSVSKKYSCFSIFKLESNLQHRPINFRDFRDRLSLR